MLGESDQAKWIPIEALPVDLQAKCARTTVNREHSEARVHQLEPKLIAIGIGALLIGGLIAIYSTRTPVSFMRVGLLMGGLALLAVWVAFARTRRFMNAEGQKLLIGPTCLVVIDAEAVRVLPAENLTIQTHNVGFVGTVIDHGFHSEQWRNELLRAQEAAADPAAQEADRFRVAAAQAQTWTAKQVRRRRMIPALVASAVGVLVALALEIGPLHARGAAGLGAFEKSKTFYGAVEQNITALNIFAAKVERDVKATIKQMERDKRLAAATSGGESEMRDFLRSADEDDPARLGVVEKLWALCAAKLPTKGLVGMARLQRQIQALACSSPTSSEFTYIYKNPGFEVDTAAATEIASAIVEKLKNAPLASYVGSPPKAEPYLELNITKQGRPLAGVQLVNVVATIHDPKGDPSPQTHSFSSKYTDTSYVAPTPYGGGSSSYGSNDYGGTVATCPGGILCGYGAGAWCCPYGTRCYPSGPAGQRCISN
jgi:hypothetical protein